jgi:AraC-like DNA-binding protein
MTIYPQNKQLQDYQEIVERFPFYISINKVERLFPAHRHDFLECSLVIAGEGQEVINGETHEMRPGVFTLLLPYQIHEIKVTSATPLTLYNCMFDMRLLLPATGNAFALADQLLTKEASPYLHLEGEALLAIQACFAELLHEFQGQAVGRELLLQLRLSELLVRFDRARGLQVRDEEEGKAAGDGKGTRAGGGNLDGKRNGKGAGVGAGGVAGVGAAVGAGAGVTAGSGAGAGGTGIVQPSSPQGSLIWKVLAYIHAHYREPLSLGDIARIYGLSVPYLSSEIKRRAGVTFTRLLQDIRMRHACSLILSTDMSHLDVALEVGFNSFKTFSRLFRERMGMTPSDYRKRH